MSRSLLRFGGNFRKVMLSVGAVGAASSIAGLGTFAGFNSSTSASQDVATGTVNIELGANGTANNRLTVGATNLAAGDTIQRAVRLSNTGSLDLASVTLTTTAPVSSVLNTDATNGLQMTVERCANAWTEGGTAPAHTYTCPGGATTVVGSRAVIGADLSLGSSPALAPTGVDHLRVTLTLPAAADNTFQAKSSTIQYTFVGTQRTATAQ
jgi:spore coat-associated protein N